MSAVALPGHCPGSDGPADLNGLSEPELRDIICQFGELPTAVRQAPFSFINGRVLDDDAFEVLISQSRSQGTMEDWTSRLQRRFASLRPYVGHYLICTFIRLPGIHYTIEVEPHLRRVVHWECQVI